VKTEGDSAMDIHTVAENAIDLFLEYESKHGDSEEVAKAKALGEISDGTIEYVIVTRQEAEIYADLVIALEKAKKTIEIWHGISAPKEIREGIWKLYQGSPEMQQINGALAKARLEKA
jgi:hypothetical protein